MNYITSDRNQTIILGHCLDDFVEKDSKARFIVKIIEQLNLNELHRNYSSQGAEYYDPKIILAIWFLAYSEGITSSRKIENLCKKHLDYIYISGNLRPDHSTLCRFIDRNKELWPKYFLQIVEIAKKQQISDFKKIMIDGTKIQAKSSKKQSMREKKLDKYLEGVREDIRKYEEEIDGTEEIGHLRKSKKELEKLENKKQLLEKRKETLIKRKKAIQPKDRENHQINLLEEEAFMMDLGNGKGYQPAYNGQIAVDKDSQLITANDLVQDRNDEKQFSTMHKKTEENLGKNNKRQYGADSGYHSLAQLKYADANNIDAYIADPKLKNHKHESFEELKKSGRKLKRIDFQYISEKDNYICPRGKILEFQYEQDNQSQKGRNYQCNECLECPIKNQCLAKGNKNQQRTIFRDYRERYAEEMREKMSSEDAKKIMMERQTSVEPVFGNIKANLGFRRFRTSGYSKVKNEFALMCIAHNLNKLFKLIICQKLLDIIKEFSSKMNQVRFILQKSLQLSN